MAKDYATATQSALRAYLKTQAAVTDLVGHRIVDEPAADLALPYVRFGLITPRTDDTDGAEGAIVQVGLEVHSRPNVGRVEAQEILGALGSALHRQPEAIAPVGFTVSEIEVLTWVVVRKSDGASYLGTMAIDVHLDA